MDQPGVVGLTVLLVVASVAPALGFGSAVGAPGGSGHGGAAEIRQIGNQSVDSTEFHITVYENTSARWTFIYTVTLANETERENFRAYADRFNSQKTELYANFVERARAVTRQGTNATGRQMNATEFSKRAYIPSLNDNRGIVRMGFVWTNFAHREGDVVEMGDVFQGGFYIGPDQRLVVERGPGLRFLSADPQPILDEDTIAESDTVTWLGERSFVDERPQVRLVPPSESVSSPTATTTGGGIGSGPGADDGDGNGGSTFFLPLLGLGVVVLLGLGAALAYSVGALPGRGDGDEGVAASADDSGGGTSGGDAASSAATTGREPEPAVADEELLEDDERVMRLLEEHGGRMKQVNIVEETGWSKSKVSMLLSDMEEEDEISKLRVGRENIISKKGMEPDAAGSPFDDEEK
ncbi:MAG: helix-turn-helix transcriptional regulator [Haloglomus sp.]